jgi:predicted nucleic acid-binding protein
MKLQTAFQNVSRVFLDTAPVIYYVEKNPKYFDVVNRIFEGIDNGEWEAITSPVTLAETLALPYRQGLTKLQQDFSDLIVSGINTICLSLDAAIGRESAKLRCQI